MLVSQLVFEKMAFKVGVIYFLPFILVMGRRTTLLYVKQIVAYKIYYDKVFIENFGISTGFLK